MGRLGLNTELPETTINSPLKVYSDACSSHSGQATAGWAFCNHNGKFLAKHSQQLGHNVESVRAETMALTRVINGLADMDGVRHVKFHTDCKPCIRHINPRTLTKEFDHATLQWIPREENVVADMVADQAHRMSGDFTPRATSNKYGLTD